MTPLDLVYDCRLRMDDEGGDTGTVPTGFSYYWEADDSGCLIKNSEWLRFLNQAHKEIAARTSCYRDGYESEVCKIKIVAGTSSYPIDTRILTIEDAFLTSTKLPLTKIGLADYREIADATTATGTPIKYTEENRPFRMTLYPIPVINDTLYLTVYRYPLDDLAWDSRTADVDEPHESLREAMIQGALMLAYQKRDADTGDGGRQQFHAREFERLVGKPVDYATLENRRWNANLDMSVRPSPYVRSRSVRSWLDE